MFLSKPILWSWKIYKEMRKNYWRKLNKKNILLTDSCTSSLEIAALLIKNKNKDEVIVPSYISSTANAFLKKSSVIFAEIDQKTLMIDIKDVLKKSHLKQKQLLLCTMVV